MKIVIVHPDLGIGGAERLIVDAAVALKAEGNEVVIYTSHHDSNHCFPETKSKKFHSKNNSQMFFVVFKVVVLGDWLPRSFLGSFYLVFAALRSIYLALYLFLSQAEKDCDLIIADQITFHLPILKFCSRSGVLFYCHFPDKFLAPNSDGFLRKGLYRRLLDWAEERCLAVGAKEIVVNSQFTRMKFKEAFKTIKKDPEVLYPGVHIEHVKETENDFKLLKKYKIFLSLNRFERKKDLHLAIEAFSLCCIEEANRSKIKLIVAGGYDERVLENREHLKELEEICKEKGLKHSTLFRKDYNNPADINLSSVQVVFLPSITQETKRVLLQQASGLLYTPSHEHFGIVPIEAMSQGLPVIAMNSGGPKETVLDGITGYLCQPDPIDMAKSIKKLLSPDNPKDLLGSAGKTRVNDNFSLKVFGAKLNNLVRSLQIQKSK